MSTALPIDDVLPDLLAALAAQGRTVLQAPPGAGKTTRVPLAMLEAGLTPGRIVMLEPRRLAARAAAERMAQTLGEKVGQTVGYRMRGDTRVGKTTRIEVVTEGILTRMIQSDPELPGIGALIFDEFHERSLNADLGLALACEVRGVLRPDLTLLVMSATLDAGGVAAMLDGAPVITAEGRAFPVDTRWLDRPLPGSARLENAVADLTLRALDETEGGVLVFLPGAGEIERTARLLTPDLPGDVRLHRLYGAMDARAQRAAVEPDHTGRKLVLASAIAETSLTIQDVRVVVDGGRARRARFDPASGMGRLVTERATRAEAEQRRGRAGRVAPGVCYRTWARAEDGAMAAYPPPEIASADLAGAALDLAAWGSNPGDLALPTQPPPGAWAEARALLAALGALDSAGRITDHGRALASMPLHPRLAHMLVRAGAGAAPLAALLSDRDPLRGTGVDLTARLEAVRTGKGADPGALSRIRAEAARLKRLAQAAPPLSPGAMAALAYPDRIGKRRPGNDPRWVLSGGAGAAMDAADALAGAPLIVATDLDGDRREARIRMAAPITEAEVHDLYADRIEEAQTCTWSRRSRRVEARTQTRLGALVLTDRHWPDAPPDRIAAALMEGVRDLGLSALRLSKTATLLRARIAYLHGADPDGWPDVSDAGLLGALEDWLLPFAQSARDIGALRALDLTGALRVWLGHDRLTQADRLAPETITTPLGRKVPLDYSGKGPAAEVRIQELFGLDRHPVTGQDARPVQLTLLSPAGRPLQVTSDLPGFWRNSYADVRRDMRGRYPKHPWPEDPQNAAPTTRTKGKGRA